MDNNDVLEFSSQQLRRILAGMDLGLSKKALKLFANSEFSVEQMEWVKNSLLRNYDLKWVAFYAKKDNTVEFISRMYQLICLLINYRLSVMVEQNKILAMENLVEKYSSYIRKLEDFTKAKYDDPKFWEDNAFPQDAIYATMINETHIRRLCFMLEKGYDYDCMVKACYIKAESFEEFTTMNTEGYTEEQIDIILDGMVDRIEYKLYISNDYSAKMMRLMYDALKEGVEPKKIKDNIWSSSTEDDIARLIREKRAFRTNQISYQMAVEKYNDEEIRRCSRCGDYYSVREFWDLNVDHAICNRCHNRK